MPYAHQFAVIADNLQAIISQGGYVFLFICTVLEGIPVLGMAVPGHITIILAGFLAKIGTLDLYWVITISIIGAVIGDCLGFYLGRKYGLSFIDRIRPYFFITDLHLEKAGNLLQKHTGKAMVIGRFTPATRALMPFLVGTSQTSAKKFWVYNIIGGISWAVLSVMLGYVFGLGYHAVAAHIGRFILVAIIAGIIFVWGYRFVNDHFHIFRRYELFTLGLNIIALVLLAVMIQDATSVHPFVANFDVQVSDFMNLNNHGFPAGDILAKIANVVTNVGGTAVMGGLGILLAIYLGFRRRWRSLFIVVASLGSTGLVLGILKEFFLRVRPENALQHIVNDPSFPSGHAGMAAAFFLVLAYICLPKISGWVKRELFLVFCVLAAIAVGLSRLVLNVHWASDVFAGWALGVFLATASILLVRYVGTLVVRKV